MNRLFFTLFLVLVAQPGLADTKRDSNQRLIDRDIPKYLSNTQTIKSNSAKYTKSNDAKLPYIPEDSKRVIDTCNRETSNSQELETCLRLNTQIVPK